MSLEWWLKLSGVLCPIFLILIVVNVILHISCTIFVPVDVIKERLQVQKSLSSKDALSESIKPYKNSYDALKTILRSEGLRGIYKGYGATLMSFGPMSAIYFMLYEKVSLVSYYFVVTSNTYGCRCLLITV